MTQRDEGMRPPASEGMPCRWQGPDLKLLGGGAKQVDWRVLGRTEEATASYRRKKPKTGSLSINLCESSGP